MPIEYYKLGDPDSPQGVKFYTKDSEATVNYGIHGEVRITEEEYNALVERFLDPLSPRTESGAYLSPEAAQKLYDEEDEDIRLYKEMRDRQAAYFARRIRKELELGIIIEEDIPLHITLNDTSLSLREEILNKLNKNEV